MSAVAEPTSQCMQALQRANRVRLARAELKRRIRSGDATVADVLLTRPWEAEAMPIAALLASQHRWGMNRVRRFLNAIPMTEGRTVEAMTERQRKKIAVRLTLGHTAAIEPVPVVVVTSDRTRLHLMIPGRTDSGCGRDTTYWRDATRAEWENEPTRHCGNCLLVAAKYRWVVE